MKDTSCRSVFAFILSLCLVLTAANDASADEQKPKREKFGSSLKRLKWDKVKQAAVEKPEKPANKKSKDNPDAEAAIQLKTLLVTFDVLVTDADHRKIIQGLSKDDFVVIEDDHPQQV